MEEVMLNDEEKGELLNIARTSVLSALEGKVFDLISSSEAFKQKVGAFVTLHKKGELRGCIGIFESNKPLDETVLELAQSAAFKDPRFTPLQADEMNDVDFEISVLSSLREISDINEIEIGKHGVFVTKDYNRGVLLPQVATEQGWDLETFLSHTCLKAGLLPDEWKKGVKIEVFSAQVFGEKMESI